MSKKAILVLADGSVYTGYAFGAEADTYGEVVFNTSMTGYQEMLTDPSYAGQIVVPTYPLIGNYGVNEEDVESNRIQVRGFIVREECLEPNHYLNQKTIHQYLAESGIPGIYGVDTRAITRKLRSFGVMMGYMTTEKTPQEALAELKKAPDYGSIDFVREVTCTVPYQWPSGGADPEFQCSRAGLRPEIQYSAVADQTGVPGDGRALHGLGQGNPGDESRRHCPLPRPRRPRVAGLHCEHGEKARRQEADYGHLPGQPAYRTALSAGSTFKLKFGHRGGNHPVRELATGRIHITAQNHGYAVDPDTVSKELEVTHINLNDGTVEGLRHKELPIFCIQYHGEASPGPLDNTYLFDQFIEMMKRK